MLVGRLLSFWEGKFWGPVLSIGGVVTWRRFKRHRDTMPPCCLIFLMFMHLATLETGTRILAVLSNRSLAKGWHFVWVEVRLKQWLRWRHWIWICRPWKFNWWGKITTSPPIINWSAMICSSLWSSRREHPTQISHAIGIAKSSSNIFDHLGIRLVRRPAHFINDLC